MGFLDYNYHVNFARRFAVRAAVAQLAARRSHNPKVGSSILSCRMHLAELAIAQLTARDSSDLKL